MSKSLAEQMALLPSEQYRAMLADFSDEEKAALEWDWKFWGRPEQFAPAGDWTTWLICAGRGFGKTRAGAEWVRDMAMSNPGCRIALVGRTTGDTLKVMIFGESGIMAISPEGERPEHKVSKSQLVWPNGSIAETFSAEEPDQLRGPQFHFAWADEAAAWKAVKDASGLNAWDNLKLATRLGASEGIRPRIIATTTPKRTAFMNEILEDFKDRPDRVVITRGSTYDNAGNLPESYLDDVTGKYQGTALARQELMGLMLEDAEGALWTPEVIDLNRLDTARPPWLPIRVVAVDPTVAEKPGDDCGIIVMGCTNETQLHRRRAVVLEDATVHGAPEVWAQAVVDSARKWKAPVVAEKVQGGALIASVIHSIDPGIKVFLVGASLGKKLRAEPVVLPYQQGRVQHWGRLPELEDELTTWDPEVTKGSPDRLDALVHGLTALLIKPPKGLENGRVRASARMGSLPGAATGLVAGVKR